jgi:hypothetical protein
MGLAARRDLDPLVLVVLGVMTPDLDGSAWCAARAPRRSTSRLGVHPALPATGGTAPSGR